MEIILFILFLICIFQISESILQKSFKPITNIPKVVATGILALGILSTSTPTFMPEIKTVLDLPKSYFKTKQIINGNVIKVIDGDTIRMKYLRFPWSSPNLNKGELLSENTLIIRLAGVDAPETAKFGNPGQELGDEVTDFVKKEILSSNIKVKLLSIDRYNRAVGLIKYRNGLKLFEKDLSQILLEKGYACVYNGGGAKYDGNKQKYLKIESQAKQKGKGMWHEYYNGETPSVYKKRLRSMEKRKLEINEPVGGRRGIRRG